MSHLCLRVIRCDARPDETKWRWQLVLHVHSRGLQDDRVHLATCIWSHSLVVPKRSEEEAHYQDVDTDMLPVPFQELQSNHHSFGSSSIHSAAFTISMDMLRTLSAV